MPTDWTQWLEATVGLASLIIGLGMLIAAVKSYRAGVATLAGMAAGGRHLL